jgi:hypothetical protein
MKIYVAAVVEGLGSSHPVYNETQGSGTVFVVLYG